MPAGDLKILNTIKTILENLNVLHFTLKIGLMYQDMVM
ncbi:hypothetical protein BOM_1214 (plasmid) [Borrelia miyamotoi FR64b]|uniref:Uncharacterized protein n=1 Tax=Borrelia miyamotoi FR64b TaxID=1292392 RepID=W5SFP0_9SPIR|nr:hypothetical protein BOM_1214 [Borrelia miyamotoi FR64b]